MRNLNICHLCGDDLNRCHHTHIPNKPVIMFNKDVTISELEAKIKLQEQRIENLLKAVRFYSNCTNNPKQYMRQGYLVYNLKKEIFIDGGVLARQALERDKELIK